MIVATADQVARLAGSSTKRRRVRMPTKAKNITAVVVSRGSQSHHTPQVGRAQIEPCRHSSPAITTPTSIAASWRASHLKLAVSRKASAAPKAKVKASIVFQAVGTCAYMMRYTSPMYDSRGATKSPRYEPTASSNAPSPMTANPAPGPGPGGGAEGE